MDIPVEREGSYAVVEVYWNCSVVCGMSTERWRCTPELGEGEAWSDGIGHAVQVLSSARQWTLVLDDA